LQKHGKAVTRRAIQQFWGTDAAKGRNAAAADDNIMAENAIGMELLWIMI